MPVSFLTHLECSRGPERPQCDATYDANELHSVCEECGKPLLCRYDLEPLAQCKLREEITSRSGGMWRFREVLPVSDESNIATFGEGQTPLLHVPRLGADIGVPNLYIKDESPIATGTFKARGMAAAVSRAKELGVTKAAVPTAGNAGGALAAYGARAGMDVLILMPSDAPDINRLECEVAGAEVVLIDGLISDCAKALAERKEAEGWFDLSTLKEPYRLEGKKIMGYELAEHFDWELPDVVIYPTGGGTGLIGMWKAFAEMELIGWISGKRPRMVTVQSTGCAPIVRAFEQGAESAEPWQDAATVAAGLRVPGAIADFLMLRALRESGGTAIAVPDEEILRALRQLASAEGMVACPEGAATVVAAARLREQGWIEADERVVLFNTGSGLKYPEALEAATGA
jgi:threonine synthase